MSTSAAGHTAASAAGSNSIPTATKKTAANRSRTGRMVSSTIRCRPDSATSAPAMNPPSATEYPAAALSTASPKQIPSAATSVVSGRRSATAALIALGTTSMPPAASASRKSPSRASVAASSGPEKVSPAASVVSTAISRIATRSSITSTPNTMSRSRRSACRSASVRETTIVLEIATMPAARSAGSPTQPSPRAAP